HGLQSLLELTTVFGSRNQRIARGDVPEGLKNKRLIELDMGALVAGAKYRGEFEERLKLAVISYPECSWRSISWIRSISAGGKASDNAGRMRTG
ncbi:MAG: hypothetical protein R6T92_11640, partial [Desulfosalsimonadaceae bacterium]